MVVGSGPNGLAAGITLAREGRSVLLIEANHEIGGGARSAELTLPGFVHDVCSAIHPLAPGSPCFRSLPLERHGLEWVQPGIPLAHPLDGGRAAWMERSVAATARSLEGDAAAYSRMMEPLVAHWEILLEEFLQPMLHAPRHPWMMARFGMKALQSAAGLARGAFTTEPARALMAGLAAHSFLPLEEAGSAAVGLMLGVMAHAAGWPMPRGGAGKISAALAAHFLELGGEIQTDRRVTSLKELPAARAILLDVTPRQLLAMAGQRLPVGYRDKLSRFQYGPGIFKIDYALSSPIPWSAPVCARAGTVHVGGTLEEIATAEAAVAAGIPPERPFVLLAQHTLFDPSRAPQGKHTAWVYCHVPNGSTFDMTERIEGQIERFAPGFRDCILARRTHTTAEVERDNANLIGGDINGGRANLWQLLARPVLSPTPYRTPVEGLYLCSASTPPSGGVHGMCGYNAARVVLRDMPGK